MKDAERPLDRGISGALRMWLAVSGVVTLCCVLLYVCSGAKGLALLIQRGPVSIAEQTLACVAIVWAACGVALALLKSPQVRTRHGVAIVCSFIILLLYVNVLRERVQYADVGDYIRAAFDLHDGRAFHSRYLYPPLLATLCQPLLPLGRHGLAAVFWLGNLASLVAFFWLLCALLEQYGFRRQLSAALVFLFMVVNVPALRTLGYVQVNLHVINLILLTLLLFPKNRILSALALALAAHLKVSPLVLAIPFFCARDRVWGGAFLAGLIGLTGMTFCIHGWAPFASFIDNTCHIYSANGICFRENSIDSLVRSTGYVFGADASPLVLFAKTPVVLALCWSVVHAMRKAAFVAGADARATVLNGAPALCVLMVFASPLVWEHHLIFLSVPFLVLTKKLDTPGAWIGYSFAYLLAFLMPTFDFYPWSFGHLVSGGILVVLLSRFSLARDAEWVAAANGRIDALLNEGAKCG